MSQPQIDLSPQLHFHSASRFPSNPHNPKAPKRVPPGDSRQGGRVLQADHTLIWVPAMKPVAKEVCLVCNKTVYIKYFVD